MEGFRELVPNEPVRFDFETVADQDGYKFRATQVWPLRVTSGPSDDDRDLSNAYGSTLTLTYDEPEPEA
jgi:hypothetical protein